MLPPSTQSPTLPYCNRFEWHSRLCLLIPTPSVTLRAKSERVSVHFIWIITQTHLCVMCTHGSVTAHGAAGITVTWVWKCIISDLIVPRFDQLKNGAVTGKSRNTLGEQNLQECFQNTTFWSGTLPWILSKDCNLIMLLQWSLKWSLILVDAIMNTQRRSMRFLYKC